MPATRACARRHGACARIVANVAGIQCKRTMWGPAGFAPDEQIISSFQTNVSDCSSNGGTLGFSFIANHCCSQVEKLHKYFDILYI